jgi:hypothetical protein
VPVGHDSLCRHGQMRTYGEVLTHARDILPLHSHYTQMSDVISVLKILEDSTQFSFMGVTLSCMLHPAKVDNLIIFFDERIHYK